MAPSPPVPQYRSALGLDLHAVFITFCLDHGLQYLLYIYLEHYRCVRTPVAQLPNTRHCATWRVDVCFLIVVCLPSRLTPRNCPLLTNRSVFESQPWLEMLVRIQEISRDLLGMWSSARADKWIKCNWPLVCGAGSNVVNLVMYENAEPYFSHFVTNFILLIFTGAFL